MAARYVRPPMDLENMRALGVREIETTCDCGRRAIVDVSALLGATPVYSLEGRLRRSDFDARPARTSRRLDASGPGNLFPGLAFFQTDAGAFPI